MNMAGVNVAAVVGEEPLVHLCSYPRSGNHLLRGIVEYFSGRPTLGCACNRLDIPLHLQRELTTVLGHVSGVAVARKHHHWDLPPPCGSPDAKMVLLLRDWHECVTRHVGHRNRSALERNLKDYSSIAQFFDKWPAAQKHVVYYDDLLLRPEETLKPLLEFLDIFDEARWAAFFSGGDLKALKAASLALYDRTERSESKGASVVFHRKRIPEHVWDQVRHLILPLPILQQFDTPLDAPPP